MMTEQGTMISLPEHMTLEERKPLLDKLYRRLRGARTSKAAKPIVEAIEQVWLTSGDDNIDFIMQNAILAMEEEDFVVAEELLDRVIELRPGYAEGWNKRAMVHFMKKEYEKALMKLRQTLALDSKHFQALHGLALVMQEIGDHRCALQAYRVLLHNHPQFQEAREAVKELNREVNGQDT
jgi:tetratricopeptide (TPR) repeat protein